MATITNADQIKMITEIEHDRAEAAKRWMEERCAILDEAIAMQKEQLKAEFEEKYNAKKKQILNSLIGRLHNLDQQSFREIDNYAKLSPEKMQIASELRQRQPVKNTKKKDNLPSTPESRLAEDLSLAFEEMAKMGIDYEKTFIITEDAFLYRGVPFEAGKSVSLKSRGPSTMNAKIDSVSKAGVTFEFHDKTRLFIPSCDFEAGKITLTLI